MIWPDSPLCFWIFFSFFVEKHRTVSEKDLLDEVPFPGMTMVAFGHMQNFQPLVLITTVLSRGKAQNNACP